MGKDENQNEIKMAGTVFKEIIHKAYNGGGAYQCSNCKARLSKGVFDEVIRSFSYCQYCGARKVAIENEIIREG